jgi:protein subunit release factor B
MNADIDARLAAVGASRSECVERFVRGTGPGGQKVNKTSSTVWIRHMPTGVEVRCQRERSQSVNREVAWALLCGRLEEMKRSTDEAARYERAREARRKRQKSRGQKARMIESKRHRASIKSSRGRVGEN